jgi:hypothetical protein
MNKNQVNMSLKKKSMRIIECFFLFVNSKCEAFKIKENRKLNNRNK